VEVTVEVKAEPDVVVDTQMSVEEGQVFQVKQKRCTPKPKPQPPQRIPKAPKVKRKIKPKPIKKVMSNEQLQAVIQSFSMPPVENQTLGIINALEIPVENSPKQLSFENVHDRHEVSL